MIRLSPVEPSLEHGGVDFLATVETLDLTTCDREPIHLPGAIQPHGVLLAIREADMTIRLVSANCGAHLGVEAPALIGAPLARAVGADFVRRLRLAVVNPRGSGGDPIFLHLPDAGVLEATWHHTDGLLIVELEPTDAGARSTLFQDMRHAMDALRIAGSVQALCDAAATEVKRLTGYDRVMVYRFHPDEHGEVVAEALEPGLEPYLGLHYPASDIPRQARKLYTLKQLGVIADVDYEPAELLAAATDAGSEPLNLSFAELRSVSPFHLAYLRGMGVQATLTISVLRGTSLWGMITCHHRAPRRIDAQLRSACRLLDRVFSLHLVTEEDRERLAYGSRLAKVESQIVERMSGTGHLADALVGAQSSPLELVSADGMVARIDGRTVTAGVVPPAHAVDALLARMRALDNPSLLVCDDLPSRFDELGQFAERASGVLALALSADCEDVILWFRGELIHTVTWGGDPDKPMVGDPTARPGEPGFAQLGPRESFEAWTQQVRGRCRPWLEAEVDAARSLAAAFPERLLARARDRLAYLAMHDALTGLPNRTLFLERVEKALGGLGRRERRVALLFVDLDRFKAVNDTLGHAAGDELLCRAAERLQTATRETDTVARFGGDEFVVLCDDMAPAQADQLAKRIVQAFHAPFDLEGRDVVVTASIGVAVTQVGATPAELMRDADTAMYRAKHSGRNAATAFTPEMRATSLRRVEIETGLRPALDRGELCLHFQPIYALDGVLNGFEALARWPLPGRGMVPPLEFIPVAEATGLIAPLTAWALDDGLRSLAGWRRQRPELDLALSVNVSGSQVTPALCRVVGDALSRHEIPPSALCLEITESALVADNGLNRRFLSDLRDRGVLLSIDDFGTGFSSLAYLSQLPVHEIKIDRAFIAGLPARRSDATVVASVVALAHQLGFRAVAEGVESEEQLEAVRRLGCDLAQGYLLGHPVASDRIDSLLLRESELGVA